MKFIKHLLLKLSTESIQVRGYLEWLGYKVEYLSGEIIVNNRRINKELFQFHKDWHYYGKCRDIRKCLYCAGLR